MSLHLQVAMASQISKIEKKIKTEEGVEGGTSRRPVSFGRMRGGRCSQMGSRTLFAKIFFLGIHLMCYVSSIHHA